MTIGTKMHQTLASLEGAAANLQTFALDTQDQMAKQMFMVLHQQIEGVSQVLRSRVNYIEQQEPQYRIMQPGMMPQQPGMMPQPGMIPMQPGMMPQQQQQYFRKW